MSARVEINPNLRLSDDQTMIDLDEDVSGSLRLYDEVQVRVTSLELVGRGWVADVDEAERTATISVEWATLRRPSTSTVGSLQPHEGSNLTIDAARLDLVGSR